MYKWEIDIAQPTAWAGHMEWATKFVEEVKPSMIVELGVHWGHSLFSFAQGVKDAELNTKIIGVDAWTGDRHTGAYDNTVYETVQFVRNKHFDKMGIRLIKKTFDEARMLIPNRAVDILHIDGAHDYESVKRDFDNYYRKVAKGGYILFHDIDVPNFGVRKLYDELVTAHPEWTHEERKESFGLGIIKINE
jgi:cephalosporin hydroxylase